MRRGLPRELRHYLLRSAQQFHIKPAAGKQHVIEGFVEVGDDDRLAAVARDRALRDPPHQLLDEGAAYALRPACGFIDYGLIERQALAIEKLWARGGGGRGTFIVHTN
jgi:hypothetical protein